MKLLPPLFIALGIAACSVMALAPSGGCGAGQIFGPATTRPTLTALGKVDSLRADYVLALRSFNDLDEAGAFKNSPEVIAVVKEIRERVPAELDAAETHARAGNAFNFDYFYNRARASVLALDSERQRRGVK